MMLNKWLEYCAERGITSSGPRLPPDRVPQPSRARGGTLIDKLSFLKGGSGRRQRERRRRAAHAAVPESCGPEKSLCRPQGRISPAARRLKQQEGATIRVQEQLDALGDCSAIRRPVSAPGVLPAARSVEDLSPAALGVRGRSDAPAGGAGDGEAQGGYRRGEAARGWPMSISACRQPRPRPTCSGSIWRRRRANRPLDRVLALLQAPAPPESRWKRCASRGGGRRRGRRSACRAQRHRHEALADFPGISLSARRNINLAIISYAELLCEHVDAFGLAARAKEAVARGSTK
jgi:hypothetical protein